MKHVSFIHKKILFLFISMLACGPVAFADVISFQGILTGTNTQPVPDGQYELTFKFYSVSESGIPIGSNVVSNVPVKSGLFSTLITVEPIWFKTATHLGISIGDNPELAPRMPLASVPYALHSKFAGNEAGDLTIRNLHMVNSGQPPVAYIRGNQDTWLFGYSGLPGAETIAIGSRDQSNTTRRLTFFAGGQDRVHVAPNGYVGIGTDNPQSRLHIHGDRVELSLTDSQDFPSGAIRGNQGTWLFGYTGIPGQEKITIGSNDGTNTDRRITFYAGGFPRMHLHENGNVGLGTLEPTSRLHIEGTARATEMQTDFLKVSSAAELYNVAVHGFRAHGNASAGCLYVSNLYVMNTYEWDGTCGVTPCTGGPVPCSGFASDLLEEADTEAVLNKVAVLPMYTATSTDGSEVRVVGPSLEDVSKVFGNTNSSSKKLDGIALVAIKGLNSKFEEQASKLKKMEFANERLERRVNELERAIEGLLQVLHNDSKR